MWLTHAIALVLALAAAVMLATIEDLKAGGPMIATVLLIIIDIAIFIAGDLICATSGRWARRKGRSDRAMTVTASPRSRH